MAQQEQPGDPPEAVPQEEPGGPPGAAPQAPLSGASRARLISRPLINPRLTADPRLRVWLVRIVIAVAFFIGFMLSLGWKYAVPAAAIVAFADIIYRSRTTSVIPAGVRVTAAQRNTRRRLNMLRPAGYLSLTACRIPGTQSIIDHIVVGPAGVFTVDSERLDERLPVRAKGGILYHGPTSQLDRIEHAEREAELAATLIGGELGQSVSVRPVMIIHGPALPWKVMRFKTVDIFDGGRIGKYFRQQTKETTGHQLGEEEIARIFAATARVLPPIEG